MIKKKELQVIVEELTRLLNNPDIKPETKEELKANVETVQAQVKSPKPKMAIFKDALSSIKATLEAATPVVNAAIPIIGMITKFITVAKT